MSSVPPPRTPVRSQVLLGSLPPLVGDLVSAALARSDVEVVHDERDLRGAGVDGPPPIVIVAQSTDRSFVGRWLRQHPDGVVLAVEVYGRSLTLSALHPRWGAPVDLTDESLVAAIAGAPSWGERFA